MIVRCIRNKREDLPPELLKNYDNYVRGQEIYMEIGAYFYVFGITFRKGVPWYLILEDDTDDYPTPCHSGLFEVAESTMPSNWRFYTKARNLEGNCIASKEWAETPLYEDLLEEESYAVKVFQEQKKIADNEIKKFLNLKQ